MRIRTLNAGLRNGKKFTAWFGPLRVTLSSPGALEKFGDHAEQRKVAATAVEAVNRPKGSRKSADDVWERTWTPSTLEKSHGPA